MANEGSTKPTYSELEIHVENIKAGADEITRQWQAEIDKRIAAESELARVRELLQRQSVYREIVEKYLGFARLAIHRHDYEKTHKLLDEFCDALEEYDKQTVAERKATPKSEPSAERQWISVEERLPEKLTRVIGWCVVGIEHLGLFVCWMNSRGEWQDSHGAFKEGSITHWMAVSAPNFRESSSLVSPGAESADIGKLDTADKSPLEEVLDEEPDGQQLDYGRPMKSGVETGKVNRVDEKLKRLAANLALAWKKYVWLFGVAPHGTEKQLAALVALIPAEGSAETGGEKADV